MNTFEWTAEKLKRFKRIYANAVMAGKNEFTFEETEFYVPYARYLIEYLDTKFPLDERN